MLLPLRLERNPSFLSFLSFVIFPFGRKLVPKIDTSSDILQDETYSKPVRVTDRIPYWRQRILKKINKHLSFTKIFQTSGLTFSISERTEFMLVSTTRFSSESESRRESSATSGAPTEDELVRRFFSRGLTWLAVARSAGPRERWLSWEKLKRGPGGSKFVTNECIVGKGASESSLHLSNWRTSTSFSYKRIKCNLFTIPLWKK